MTREEWWRIGEAARRFEGRFARWRQCALGVAIEASVWTAEERGWG